MELPETGAGHGSVGAPWLHHLGQIAEGAATLREKHPGGFDDLLFYGIPGHIHHVGIYIGDGLMIDAPDFGLTITTEHYRWTGDDYTGATRPAN